MNDLLYEKFLKLEIGTEKALKPFWNRTTCPKCSEEKKTKATDMSFNMTDGRYICHRCAWKGNVIYQKKEDYVKPVMQDYKPSDKVKEYFLSRGIEGATYDTFIERKLIAPSPKGDGFVFYYFRGDEYINYKARSLAEKKFFQQRDGEKILYNINSAKGKTKAIIVEGEMSVLACIQAGLEEEYAVLSLENGASREGSVDGKFAGLRNCYEQLQGIESWIVALDDDQAGVYTGNELIKYLGEHKCKIIQYPKDCKDPDDIINRNKRGEFTSKQNNDILKEMMLNAVEFPVKGIIQLTDKLKELLMSYKKYGRPPAVPIPRFEGNFSFKRGDLTVISGFANVGKALCIKTDIPTLNGWKKMEDLQVGDIVFDETGKECNVTATSDIFNDRNCYELVFSDGNKVICDEEHLWETYTSAERTSKARQKKRKESTSSKAIDQRHKCLEPQIRTTKEIVNNFFDQRGRIQHTINLAEPVCFREKELPIDPYVLGYWLGDGDSGGGRITTADKQVIKIINSLGYKTFKRKGKYRYTIIGLTTNTLRREALLNNKHIPHKYLFASIEQRKKLLMGLMDSDGHTAKKGSKMCEFCSIKKELAYQVYELICGLGIKATIKESDAKLYGRIISKRYRIVFKATFDVFGLYRKKRIQSKVTKCKYRHITSFKKIESTPTKCISVDSPNNLYLCTKAFIPTHNSLFSMNLLYLMLMEYQWKWVVFAGEQHPQDRYFEDLAAMILQKPIEDKDRKGNPIHGCATPEEYEAALEFISNHIYLVYPERGQKPTLEWIMEKVNFLKQKHGINGVILDTFNKMKHDFRNMRDDVYLDDWLDLCLEHSSEFDAFLLLMHPAKPSKTRSGSIPMMNMYDIAGGAMTPNKVDNVIIYHREYTLDNNGFPSSVAKVKFDKIRDQKTVGRPSVFDMEYDPFRNGFKYGEIGYVYSKTLNTVTNQIINGIENEEYLEELPF